MKLSQSSNKEQTLLNAWAVSINFFFLSLSTNNLQNCVTISEVVLHQDIALVSTLVWRWNNFVVYCHISNILVNKIFNLIEWLSLAFTECRHLIAPSIRNLHNFKSLATFHAYTEREKFPQFSFSFRLQIINQGLKRSPFTQRWNANDNLWNQQFLRLHSLYKSTA